jgi:hypothetical protein
MEQLQHVKQTIDDHEFDIEFGNYVYDVKIPKYLWMSLTSFCHRKNHKDYKKEIAKAIYFYLVMNDYPVELLKFAIGQELSHRERHKIYKFPENPTEEFKKAFEKYENSYIEFIHVLDRYTDKND